MINPNDFYINHGIKLDRAYIGVPHSRPPILMSPDIDGEPDTLDGDRFVRGDHDLSLLLTIDEASVWSGHQKYAVRALADRLLNPEWG